MGGGVEGMYMSVDANQTRRGHWILAAGGIGSCEQDGVLGTEFWSSWRAGATLIQWGISPAPGSLLITVFLAPRTVLGTGNTGNEYWINGTSVVQDTSSEWWNNGFFWSIKHDTICWAANGCKWLPGSLENTYKGVTMALDLPIPALRTFV